MRSKKGFELSATFMVMLIITIVIFTGSIQFTRKFFASAEEMKGRVDAETEAEIQSLLYNQNALVGLPLNKKTLSAGQSSTFGLGIRNTYEEEKEFYLRIDFANAYNIHEEIILDTDSDYIEDNWALYNEGPHLIDSNDFITIPILINVDIKMAEQASTERPATYVFNVCVFDDPAKAGTDCIVESRAFLGEVYGKKVLKINVEVP